MDLVPTPDGSVSSAVPAAASPGAAPSGVTSPGAPQPGKAGTPGGPKAVDKETTAGVLFGVGAYGLWGLLPLYFFVSQPAGAVEIVANRVVWSLLFCALLITVTRAWRVLGAAFRNRSVIGTLAVAAGLIAVNWLTYTYGVTTGQAVEASLGYFINPLVSVLLGVFVLKEKLRPLQWAAVGIGFIAVGRADRLLWETAVDCPDPGRSASACTASSRSGWGRGRTPSPASPWRRSSSRPWPRPPWFSSR